jgi:hypothetical protein
MPDGRIIYGESPQPGAKRVDKVPAPPESTGVLVATPQDKIRADKFESELPKSAGVAVIPDKVRPPTGPAVQGRQGNSMDKLPQRSY